MLDLHRRGGIGNAHHRLLGLELGGDGRTGGPPDERRIRGDGRGRRGDAKASKHGDESERKTQLRKHAPTITGLANLILHNLR